jgi:hypothetical protein
MQDASVPPKIQIPWANSAGSANIRTIPQASQLAIQAGAASFTDGFVPLNLTPVSAGGVPPFGQDMNGILRLITQWLQWGNAGGAIRYDAGFVAAIGGYPIGSRLMSNSGHVIFESLVDNNSGDPNAGAPNWRVQSSVWSLSPWQAAGSSNVQTVLLNPAPTSTAQLSGIPITLLSQGTNTGPVTLSVNGLPALPIVTTGGVPLAPGVLVTSYPFTVRLLGSAFVMMSEVSTGRFLGVQEFISSGTYVPTPGMASVIFEVQGGGAASAGAGGAATGNVSLGAPGTSGAYAKGRFTAAQVGASQSVVIGVGGIPVSNGVGGNGGASSVGALITAPGGVGGGLLNNQVPPTANGNGTTSSAPTGGNIDSSVGTAGFPSLALSVTLGLGGQGGGSPFGQGGATPQINNTGVAAVNAGTGGAGCVLNTAGGSAAGGAGFRGIVLAWEYS